MSLAHRVEAARDLLSAPQRTRQDEGASLDQGAERQKLSLVRPIEAPRRPSSAANAAHLGKVKPPSEDGAGREAVFARTEGHDAAMKLLDEVSSIVPVLAQENQALRLKLGIAKERAALDLEIARELACEWREAAETGELRINALEAQLKEALERAARAEQVANAERELALRSSKDAAEAECLSSLFEDKVLSSFGVGSLFQSAMDKIRDRDALDP